ncbi:MULTISPECIES: glycosyltransferase family 2 protein [unclassified Sulfuricurvum]|uniref:glycosyltransferase family 2 protein n=1 Tax=unclassified Sulfuricurvum TaxID=2632390 RepID=UPI0002999C95|nr:MULTISPECIES: glycosyltransferase family 2 protein [unclassified Sulfuricurvum]AFV98315.1 hypothetical protein B649_10015 [Candidatus Sulfuricurvum sp. RIFRC-1]HBM36506.1 glycosyltransferase family 2 protein [Sulfuricurvum sp.]
MSNNLITILIPTYNRLELLQKAYNSCKNQTDIHFDLIVVDNASDDGTQQFLKTIHKEDKIISELILNPINLGATLSITNALTKVKTRWVTILCDDDTIEPNFIEKSLPIISTTNTGFVITGFRTVDENGNTTLIHNTSQQTFNRNKFLLNFLNGKIQTAGVSGFFFINEIISKPKNYPKGFLSDTMICVEAGLYNGAELIAECLYNRLEWSGSESTFSIKNTKMYFESLLLFGQDLTNLLDSYQLTPDIVQRAKQTQSLKHFFWIVLFPILRNSSITLKDLIDFSTLIDRYDKRYFLHFTFMIILYPFMSKISLPVRQKLFSILRDIKRKFL